MKDLAKPWTLAASFLFLHSSSCFLFYSRVGFLLVCLHRQFPFLLLLLRFVFSSLASRSVGLLVWLGVSLVT